MASSLPPPVPHHTLTQAQGIIPHPNGSDGWLPAEEITSIPLSPKQETVLPPATSKTSAVRRSTISTSPTKSTFHARPTSRQPSTTHPIEARQSGRIGGTAATSDEELQNRAVSVNNNLTPKQRSRLAKSEAKDGRRISKIIKAEGKTEKQALDIAIKELEEIQKFQNNTIKSEARAQANHSKSFFAFKKTEAAYLNAKMRYETAQAELNAEAEALDVLKNNSKQAAERVQEKSAEVDSIRSTLAIDERERKLRLTDLKGSTLNGAAGTKRSSSLWRN